MFSSSFSIYYMLNILFFPEVKTKLLVNAVAPILSGAFFEDVQYI